MAEKSTPNSNGERPVFRLTARQLGVVLATALAVLVATNGAEILNLGGGGAPDRAFIRAVIEEEAATFTAEEVEEIQAEAAAERGQDTRITGVALAVVEIVSAVDDLTGTVDEILATQETMAATIELIADKVNADP